MSDRRPVIILVELTAKPEHEEDVKREASDIFARIRRDEPACTYISGHQSSTEPTRFMFYEEWRDIDEFDDFVAQRDYMSEYFTRLDDHIEHRGFVRWIPFA